MTSPTSTADAETLLRHAGWVRALALRLVRDPDRADDLAQETCLAALRQRPDVSSPLRGWLATVLRNRVRQEARATERRTERERAVSRDEGSPSTLDLVERLTLHRRVVEVVTALEEPYREAILMRYFEQRTPTEIARRTGVPLSTVKTRLGRGLERLRWRLDREHGGERRAWAPALLAFARPSGPTPIEALGVLLVSTQVKLAAATALVAAGAYVFWPSDVPSPPASGLEAAAPELDAATPVEGPAILGAGDARGERVAVSAGRSDAVPEAAREAGAPAVGPLLGPLAGRVLDSEGTPLGGVPLLLVPPGPAPGSLIPDAYRVRSGAGGVFRFDMVGGGRIVAEGPEWVTVFSGYAEPQRRAAQPVVVVARRRPMAGRVVDEAGLPLEGVRVSTRPPPGFRGRFDAVMDFSIGVANATTTDADGSFALPDTPGIAGATLDARLLGYGPHSESLSDYPVETLTITLRRPIVVEGALVGRVVDEGGRGVPDARVTFGIEATSTDADGSFRFDLADAASANRLVERFIEGHQPSRLIAMKEGHLPARLDATPLEEGDALAWPQDIVLVLRGQPLTLAGRVVDPAGEPRRGVRVWVAETTLFSLGQEGGEVVESFLAGRSGQSWVWEETDAAGRFELRGLMERDYTVVAMDATTLQRASVGPLPAGSRGVRVELGAGQLWRRVAGRVVARDSSGVEGVSIRPMTDAFRQRYAGQVVGTSHSTADGVVTGEDGAFELAEVPRDLVYLRLDGEGIMSMEYGRHVEGGLAALAGERIADLEIVVGLRLHLQVTLADPDAADTLEVLDGEGQPIEINVIMGTSRRESRSVGFQDGRTDVLTVGDSAATLRLSKDGREVSRRSVTLVRGEVNQVRL